MLLFIQCRIPIHRKSRSTLILYYHLNFDEQRRYGCYPPMLLAASGGNPINGWTLDEVLDLIRGTFVLHTRGSDGAHPIEFDSSQTTSDKYRNSGTMQKSHWQSVQISHSCTPEQRWALHFRRTNQFLLSRFILAPEQSKYGTTRRTADCDQPR